ncbi:MAG: acetylxylan esterase [Bacteroidota bacterium]|nr:acetylxylan esterase [Bacteroidota bacterium]
MKILLLIILSIITPFGWTYLSSQEVSQPRIAIDKKLQAKMAHESTSEGRSETRPQLPAPTITFAFDKKDAIYKTGEEAVFTVAILNPDKSPYSGKCQFQLTDENSKSLKGETLEIVGGKAEYKATSNQPGFIRLYITAEYQGRNTSNYATAGFEPEKITASQTFPDDFMAFWTKQKATLDAIPMDLHRVEFDGPNPDFKYEYIDFQNIDGKRFYFIMSQPKKPGKYRISMRIPGAGIYKRHVHIPEAPNTISIELSVHDFPINQPIETYEKLIPNYFRMINGKKVRYECFDIQDREKYYYKSVLLGLWRTLDIACAEPNADVSKLMVSGGSQGGGLTLAIAGLDQRIKYIEVQCPVLCDHTAAIRQPGREAGWPHVLESVEKPEFFDEAVKVTAYYDNCNFARFIKAPVFIAQGFNDKTVPPSGTYAVFALIKSPKELYTEPFSAHGFTPEAVKQIALRSAEFRLKYFGLTDKNNVWKEGGDNEK